MKLLAIAMIRGYQRFISPYKGFRCAHAHLHQGPSCSHAVLEIVKADGLYHGYRAIRLRIKDCKQAYQTLQSANNLNRSDKGKKRKEKDKWYDCCDPSIACDAWSCGKSKHCDLPDLPCDCWP
ncbi:membrane protein insertion efficiency factor YidD [Motilimonas cestriensis]|uniref:membrane protein insertion efficiency factor YidD n=1 Tax=Motilimonas cestriensis TaxID=2742685 RepID=UPI003DA654DF